MPHPAAVADIRRAGGIPRAGDRSTDAAIVDNLSGLSQPLVLDLGCGNGVFLSGFAAICPECTFLGIEKKEYRVRQAMWRLRDFPKASVIHGEVTEVLRFLPEQSVAAAYLLFSDPWPKRRHAVRRLVQPELIALLDALLESGGVFFFASDSAEYARWSEGLFRASGWSVMPWEVSCDWPRTEFEQRFVSAGLNITRFQATR